MALNFSRFNLKFEYLKGEDNLLPDALSRWAYPASQALEDLTKHGSVQDALYMRALIYEEEEDEKHCMAIGCGSETPFLGGSKAPEFFFSEISFRGGPKRRRKIFLGLLLPRGPKVSEKNFLILDQGIMGRAGPA